MALRFLMEKKIKHEGSGGENTSYYTLTDVEQLECSLRAGGHSQYGYEIHQLLGVEVLTEEQTDE